jgi:GNAT superfamily N-acetyltransferase
MTIAPPLPTPVAAPASARRPEMIRVDRATLAVRPIEADDADRLQRMFERLSPESRLFRFLAPVHRLTPLTLLRLAAVDHERREALVALDGDEIVAVARYDELAPRDGHRRAEVALTVEDAWQRHTLGRRLVRRLGALAADRGYDTFVATIMPENRAALGLVHRLARDARVAFVGGHYEAHIPLAPPDAD